MATMHLEVPKDALERSLTHDDSIPNDQEKLEIDAQFNIAAKVRNLLEPTYEDLERKEDDKPPPLELKPLPDELRYEFLGETRNCPLIVYANLSESEVEKLMAVLRSHTAAFGYSLSEFRGIKPSVAIHRITIEEGTEPV